MNLPAASSRVSEEKHLFRKTLLYPVASYRELSSERVGHDRLHDGELRMQSGLPLYRAGNMPSRVRQS